MKSVVILRTCNSAGEEVGRVAILPNGMLLHTFDRDVCLLFTDANFNRFVKGDFDDLVKLFEVNE